jgi:hypothetical protein
MKHKHRSSIPPEPPRKKGAQPGNSNAMKHGFYSALFKDRERQLLHDLPAADLSAEIELIRVTNARFLEALMATKGTQDYEANLTALRAINLSAQSIAMLLRAQAVTGATSRDLSDLAHQFEALDEKDPNDQASSVA